MKICLELISKLGKISLNMTAFLQSCRKTLDNTSKSPNIFFIQFFFIYTLFCTLFCFHPISDKNIFHLSLSETSDTAFDYKSKRRDICKRTHRCYAAEIIYLWRILRANCIYASVCDSMRIFFICWRLRENFLSLFCWSRKSNKYYIVWAAFVSFYKLKNTHTEPNKSLCACEWRATCVCCVNKVWQSFCQRMSGKTKKNS